MSIAPLPPSATLDAYEKQAHQLLESWRGGDPAAIRIIRQADASLSEARLALARWYDFESWTRLAEYVEAVTQNDSPVARFESAVEALIHGDIATLASLLRDHPELVRARSTRATRFDPPVHRATLLHYVAANGVEGYRQKTPQNAVAIATLLLEAGAEVDALAELYGGHHTTLSMLVSSDPPAKAGLQVALVDRLLDFGAAIEGDGSGEWTSPLMTALAFGYQDAADALVQHGARVDSLAAAAGLGRLSDARQRMTNASSNDRHRALALAAQHGHVEIVRLLLDAGEDPNRHNPRPNHPHSTPLHQAVWSGHDSVVRLLVERQARLDIKDTLYEGTPLEWAIYGGRTEIADYLRNQAATIDEG